MAGYMDGFEMRSLERSPSLSDRVTALLLELIDSSELRPGDRLPSERELATGFKVSRTVIREAIRSLGAKGVLEVSSGSGARIVPVSPKTASDAVRLYVQSARAAEGKDGITYEHVDQVRELLEGAIAHLAAQKRSDEDLADMRASIDAMREGESLQETSRSDVAFHRALAAATGNPLFALIYDSLDPILLEIRMKTLHSNDRREQAAVEHERILEHVSSQDAQGALQAMNEHLAISRSLWDV
jgi:GntR family transcriptional regulator, transcriptional repressor for pyruvate dehydrogenase complex